MRRANHFYISEGEEMGQKSANVIRSKSQINYSYATIKITQSRIDKGLIAIPMTLSEWFPDRSDTIQVYKTCQKTPGFKPGDEWRPERSVGNPAKPASPKETLDFSPGSFI
jgi:hypothetical protein